MESSEKTECTDTYSKCDKNDFNDSPEVQKSSTEACEESQGPVEIDLATTDTTEVSKDEIKEISNEVESLVEIKQEKSPISLTEEINGQEVAREKQSDSNDSKLLNDADTVPPSFKEEKSEIMSTDEDPKPTSQEIVDTVPLSVPDTNSTSDTELEKTAIKSQENKEDTKEPKPTSPKEEAKPLEISTQDVKLPANTSKQKTPSPPTGIRKSKNVPSKSKKIIDDVSRNQDSSKKPGLTKTANQVRSARHVVDTMQEAAEFRDDKSSKQSHTSPLQESDGEISKKKLSPKSRQYRDPRKPPIYPHRMTKTTIARQALAREKRRMYVEERIQSYMKDTKSSPNSMMLRGYNGSPYRSSSSQHLDKDYATTGQTESISYISSKEKVGSSKYYSRTSSSLRSTKARKYSHLQSLPEINSLNDYNVESNYHHDCGKHFEPPENISAISILRPPPYSYSSSYARAEHSGVSQSQSHSDLRSHTTTIKSESRSSGIYVDSNPEVTSNFWKNASEQGFFYSFRVRQSGTVQMIDRAVQTGEQPQSYILDFSRQSNGTYYLKSSKPITPESSSFMHLPPINSKFGQPQDRM